VKKLLAAMIVALFMVGIWAICANIEAIAYYVCNRTYTANDQGEHPSYYVLIIHVCSIAHIIGDGFDVGADRPNSNHEQGDDHGGK
jgi:hypothetical protein